MGKKILRILRSPKFVLGLLVYLAVFSGVMTSLVNKTFTSSTTATLGAFGLTNPFGSVWFLVPLLALLISTALCALTRTKVARSRARQVRGMDLEKLAKSGVDIGSYSQNQMLEIKRRLHAHGFRPLQGAERDDDSFQVSGRSLWALYASPFFHWMLVLLVVVILMGRMTRAEGMLPVPVDQRLAFSAQKLSQPRAGLLYRWSNNPVRIGVSQLKLHNNVGGVEMGTAPRVTIYDSTGKALAEGLVYSDNKALSQGSLTVHYIDYGMALTVSLRGSDKKTLSKTTQTVQLDPNSPTGYTASTLTVTSAQGNVLRAVIQLEPRRVNGKVVTAHFNQAQANVRVTDATTGQVVADKLVDVGQAVALPDGTSLRFDNLNYYALLTVVDDWSITFIYLCSILAIIGASCALLTSPRVAFVGVTKEKRIVVVLRFYRPSSITTEELLAELQEAKPDNTSV